MADRAQSGDVVEVRGEEWLVTRVESFGACDVLRLEGRGRENAGLRWSAVSPFDRPTATARERPVRRSRAAVLRTALAAIAAARPADGLWAAAEARLTLLPYQLEPALAVLGGATRVLLADAVGLGKTVQAGLILAELRARGVADRALVLVPAGLRGLWRDELRDCFGLTTTIVDYASIAACRPWMPPDANPWASDSIVITSLDFAKRPEVLAAIEDAPFDLLVADEAHHLTPGSDRGAAVARLAARVPWVVLVSATPHSGDEPAFVYLTSLGSRDDDLAVFRRTRRDVGVAARRATHLLSVRPSDDERRMLASAEAYARAIWEACARDAGAARLVATTVARRGASSADALARTLERRLSLMSAGAGALPRQPLLPWEEVEAGDEDGDDAWLGCPILEDADAERHLLQAALELARRAQRASSKVARLLRLLARVGEPAVVFTEYRDTLVAIARAIGPTHTVAAIHGGLSPALRQEAVDRFTRGGADVLLATDAAGEGLSLHRRCRLVITIELPWNPLRLEQRVGRVDRIGQAHRVHAFHLFHRGSIEDQVLARLERRRVRAAAGLEAASHWMTEREVADAALGGSPDPDAREPRVIGARVPRATAEADRLMTLRRRTGPSPRRPVWTPPRRRPSAPAVVVLYDVRHTDARSRLLERRCVAAEVTLASAPATRRDWRRMAERLSVDGDLRDVVNATCAQYEPRTLDTLAPFSGAAAARISRIMSDLGHRDIPPQPTLFDRRAEREALVRAATRARWETHLERRLATLRLPAAGGMLRRTRVVAIWPMARHRARGRQ